MEPTHFDRLTRAIADSTSRRTLLARTTTIGLATALVRLGTRSVDADAADEVAAERKKHKKRKKRKCPKTRRCGKKRCCSKSQICAGGVCITGQGTCPTGADTCEVGVPVLCSANCACVASTEGTTRCAQAGVGGPCGGCASSADCAAFSAGAFCAVAGTGCGCQAGEGICTIPCAA